MIFTFQRDLFEKKCDLKCLSKKVPKPKEDQNFVLFVLNSFAYNKLESPSAAVRRCGI